MERLDPAVHHLRKAGDLLNQRDRDAGFGERAGGAAGGNDLDPELFVQRASKLDDSGLVVDADQRGGES